MTLASVKMATAVSVAGAQVPESAGRTVPGHILAAQAVEGEAPGFGHRAVPVVGAGISSPLRAAVRESTSGAL